MVSDRDTADRLDHDRLMGLEFPIVEYEVSREKIREYVGALGDRNPIHCDAGAALLLGHRNLVAPPTFAAVFALLPFRRAVADASWCERAQIDPGRILHAGQSFQFACPVCPGDRLIIQSGVTQVAEKHSMTLLTIATRVDSERGERILDATTTLALRAR